jgi:hypothetical protein
MASDRRKPQSDREPIEQSSAAPGLAEGGDAGHRSNGTVGNHLESHGRSVTGESPGLPPEDFHSPDSGGAATPAGGAKPAGGADDFDPLEALRQRLLRGSEAPYGLDSDPARRQWSALWRLLTARVGAKGRGKQPATIRVEATATGFRATLSDLTLSVAVSAEAEHLEGLYDALEREIRNPKAMWRELRHGERAAAVKNRNSKNPVDWET